MSLAYRRVHGRRVRVATKYMNLTRRFFSHKGVTGYRIVESLDARRGTPAAGLAELIVDITTTGATLKANGLRPLDDGLITRRPTWWPPRPRPGRPSLPSWNGRSPRALWFSACHPGIPRLPWACPEGQRNIAEAQGRTLRLRLWVPDSRTRLPG